MVLKTGGTIVSYNVHTKALLEPSGDKQTQVDGIWFLMNVKFVHPLTSVPI